MKKVLFTTTALVAFAGAASAEVALSGSAEMGLVNGDRYGITSVTQFHTDIDVKFSMSGETDNGLTFGATIDLDEIDEMGNGINPGHDNDNVEQSMFISGSFGTVTMGNTDGAHDWAMKEVGMGSAISDDHTTHAGYNFNSGHDGDWGDQVLRYDNTFGDFGVAASVTIYDFDSATFDNIFGLGVKYNLGLGGTDIGLGLGYQSNGVADIMGVSVSAALAGGISAVVNYSDLDGDGGMDNHMGIGIGFASGPVSASVNYGQYEGVLAVNDADGFGLAVNYDLGGGAVGQFGYGSDVGGTGEPSWSAGLAMSF